MTFEQYEAWRKAIHDKYAGLMADATVRTQSRALDVLQGAFSSMTSAMFQEGVGFGEAVWGAFRDAAIRIFAEIAASSLFRIVMNILNPASATAGIFTGVLSGIKSFFGFAEGGTIGPGQFGWVGERGLELAYSRPGGGTQIMPMSPGSNAPTGGQGGYSETTIYQGLTFIQTRDEIDAFNRQYLRRSDRRMETRSPRIR